METITVEVKQDHIDRLSKAKNPILGVVELIWNSFDADATEVAVRPIRNSLGAISSVEIADNGLGIPLEEARTGFRNLGGSWKQTERRTRRDRRLVHGRQGQGRFRGFAVGEKLDWQSVYEVDGRFFEFSISANASDKRTFNFSDEAASATKVSGTVVVIHDVVPQQRSLETDKAVSELTRVFALYLRQYPNVVLSYDRLRVDPAAAQERVSYYDLSPFTTEDGEQCSVELAVVEWKIPIERAIYLCNPDGFALHEVGVGIQAPGYEFTAYLKSSVLAVMAEEGTIELDEFADLRRLLVVAREKLKSHFALRDTENAASIVERWKQERIYPYEGEPKSVLESTERKVFDVVAASIDNYLPDFKEAKPKSKKFTFDLVRYAVESNPSALKRIMREVIDLPKDKQEEFARLLEKTSLVAMISAAKIVADRLEFLKGLDYLLFDPEAKRQFQERTQLHKLVAQNTWLFGDEFLLVNDEETLTTVLRKHLKHAKLEVDLAEPVLLDDGGEGRVDVVIGKAVSRHPNFGRHNLVIELKRPSEKINLEVNSQVKKYALAVARDERFRGLRTDWTFWAVSDDITEDARQDSEQDNRAPGILWTGPTKNGPGSMTVWVKIWSQIIEECRGRLQFFQEKLQYSASQGSGLKYLQETYEKFIPTPPHAAAQAAPDQPPSVT